MTPADAERYRRKADECRAKARTAPHDDDRAGRLRLAEVYIELAECANGGAPGNAEEEIKKRAYEIWQRHGRPEGEEDEFWQQAKQELRNEDKSSPIRPPRTRAERS
ncbi:DUF2934 domain-containing protein [Bradyrhizobium sp. AUGA SZCCT0283]|uniref:DUF2934 domain-containing protein n=1 Tax=Bradyrhizobium sp. AUGA SZCCT0283 TaxID=2807671 RepID=UPI001BA51AE8|nr:DUF2934 domain-containing protein [Bradyrhizobium sp. AUGA SZCCT0283]MBR1279650.1 DUF2934 domain-containing protein [Bradyrhizobium sp. AUGA SZCCT0283]